jgi:hypothetical protein
MNESSEVLFLVLISWFLSKISALSHTQLQSRAHMWIVMVQLFKICRELLLLLKIEAKHPDLI